jgi:uncharacterized protein (TIGR04255 family)
VWFARGRANVPGLITEVATLDALAVNVRALTPRLRRRPGFQLRTGSIKPDALDGCLKDKHLSRPADLPDFEDPPLVEVALSVQFSELRAYRTVHAGILWAQKLREAYPKFAEHPPLNPTFEAFGPKSPAESRFEFKQLAGPPVPRLWFLNADESELIQFQADRLVHNWRKTGLAGDYPRYESLKDRFFEELDDINRFFQDENIGKIEPNQCEVTYVNAIRLEDGTDIRLQPEIALRNWCAVELGDADPVATLPQIENATFSVRYVIQSNGEPIGRLHVSAQPADGKPALRLDLTARGAPSDPSFAAVASFLDQGREAVVRGFTALTTPEMHRLWRRIK